MTLSSNVVPVKLRWKIIIFLVLAGALSVFAFLRSENRAEKALKETHRVLHQQGFKTDLAEFNFSISGELRERASLLIRAGSDQMGQEDGRRAMLLQDHPNLMMPAASNSALVVWKHEILPTYSSEDVWPLLREALTEISDDVDAAGAAALSGQIAFNLDATAGHAMPLPHLAAIRRLVQTFGRRTVIELRDGNNSAAWRNVIAASRVVTAWKTEPVAVSQLVRFSCAGTAFTIIWQALQANAWSDEQLASLQQEWESVDIFRRCPETAAFTRASMAGLCQAERTERLTMGITLSDIIQSPQMVWHGFKYFWRQVGYRKAGTFEDEKALLLFHRDRELELRRAIQCSTWTEMRQLPGVTNVANFQSKFSSRAQSMMNLRQLGLGMAGQGRGFLARAAETEARRRMIICAIALQRYRVRHGTYPQGLESLTPDFLKNTPIDFIDGKPLRYDLTDGGSFVLYSVGLDCVDNGGRLAQRGQRRSSFSFADRSGNSQEYDLLWPRPARKLKLCCLRRRKCARKLQTETWRRRSRNRESQIRTVMALRYTAVTLLSALPAESRP